MRFGKYTILNERTFEVLTKSNEHGIMTIEHLTEFVETDPKQFAWLESDIQEAKKYLEKKSYKEVTDKRFCSVCGVTALTNANTDTCANCSSLDENVQRAFIAIRSTVIEQNELIEELHDKVGKSK
jgi:hypothetical protein